MVQAILAGNKTQTRRIVKPQPEGQLIDVKMGYYSVHPEDLKAPYVKCPYGEVGDVLWVRETWRKHYPTDGNGNVEWSNPVIDYAADNPDPILLSDGDGFHEYDSRGNERYVPFKPSIHMPYTACRIWLEIVSIRAERLQDISEADAIAEGVASTPVTFTGATRADEVRYQDYSKRHDIDHPLHQWCHTAKHSYHTLWAKINGTESWGQNPYVWVVEFKQVSKPA